IGYSFPTSADAPSQTIAVWSFGFAPSPIRLAAGKEVTLTFQNRSGSNHDFSAKGFFDHARIVAGAAPEGEIDLPPHATKVITLVPGAGTFHAHCSHFMHETLGMTAQIIVSWAPERSDADARRRGSSARAKRAGCRGDIGARERESRPATATTLQAGVQSGFFRRLREVRQQVPHGG